MATRADSVEYWVRLVGVAAIVASGCWAVYSYRENTEKEARRPVWERQLTLYFQITEAAGKIVALKDGDPQRGEALQIYWTLYHGPLVVVQDLRTVADANIAFGKCLIKPGFTKPEEDCDASTLQLRAIALALACKQSIGESWDRKLQNLKSPYGPEGFWRRILGWFP
jgi:hypothetical protein